MATQLEMRAELETMERELAEMIPHLAPSPDRDMTVIALRRVRQYLAESVIPDDALEVMKHY